ncbi:MAG: Fe-S cluster protein [Parcubacteria group bacterium]|jgi:nitrogen fixation NifU-like protein|nr:Fe-S cluster protein [Parcubacteria group bacterium]|tara:strand:- start:4316 stop:4696 length:381 start_codon:yes stop_codon:yes gene_type:complete
MAELYKQVVFRHYKSPLNKRKLIKPSKKFRGVNPFCGDSLEIFVKLDKSKKIKEIGWEGKGCTISQASASILTEMMKGKSLEQIKKIKSGQFLKNLNMNLSPSRRKCALLSLYTIKELDITDQEAV